MTTWLRKAAAWMLCALLLSVYAVPAAASDGKILPSGISTDELGGEIEAYVSDHADTTAGMSVAVFDREESIYRGYFGFADVEAQREVDAETVMEWGSVTKLMVWISVMQLWEQGKLQLDEDVRSYLPEGFLRNLRYDEPVTMLHLMNHNAGFEESIIGMVAADPNQVLPLEAYLKAVQPYQAHRPGTVTAYSNWGVALAGFIVEQVSGTAFYEYAWENIFIPLGMEHSAILPTLEDNPWVQTRREMLKNYSYDGQRIENARGYFSIYPAGMCTSTLEDLAIFGKALLNRESPLFEDPATYDLFLSPSSWAGDTEIGLSYHGLWNQTYFAADVIGHGGNTFGCSAMLLLDLENGIGMVVMTNQNGEDTYTTQMPSLIYGCSNYPSPEYTGYVLSARTNAHGPMKLNRIFSISHISQEEQQEGLLILHDTDGIRRITAPGGGGDFLLAEPEELILFVLPVIVWAVALVFCMLGLAGQGIAALVRRYRQRRRKLPMVHWQWLGCAVQLLPFCWAVPGYLALFGPGQWPLWMYRLVFGSILAFAAVDAGFAVWGIAAMCRRKKATAFQIALVISLFISIFNIFYWQLGHFWML